MKRLFLAAMLGAPATGFAGADEASREKVLFAEPFAGELGKI
jgi:hypothetical protein